MFVQNNISNRVREHIVTSVCGFFTLEEVTKAKDLLFEVAERCKSMSTGLLDKPHNKLRVAEVGRAKAYVNDMLNLWEVLDTAKANLPSFGAVDMKRYPPVALADSDMFGSTVNILDVRSEMADVKSQVSTMVSQMKKMEDSQRLLAERLNHDATAKESSWPSWSAISGVSARPTAVDLAAPPAIHLSALPAVSGSVGSDQSALPSPSS